MPMPLSQTSIRTLSPTLRHPSRILPRSVYRSAFESKLRIIVSSIRLSLRTTSPERTARHRNPLSVMESEKSAARDSNISEIAKSLLDGRRFPASRRFTSSRLDRIPDMVSRDRAIPPTRSRPSPSVRCSPSAPCRNLSVCNGCRKSWLAADRKLDFARSANAADFQAREISSSNRLRSVMSVARPLMHTGFPAEST